MAWDVVQVEAAELSMGCDEGLLMPIDGTKLGSRDALLAMARRGFCIG